MPTDDAKARELSEAIREAAKAKQWKLVEELNLTLRQIAASKRRKMSGAHKLANAMSNSSVRAHSALLDEHPGAAVLAAFAYDDRFGSLRRWCDERGFNRTTVSMKLSGKLPMTDDLLKALNADFPELEWIPLIEYRSLRKR